MNTINLSDGSKVLAIGPIEIDKDNFVRVTDADGIFMAFYISELVSIEPV